jgi:hypothetical protein
LNKKSEFIAEGEAPSQHIDSIEERHPFVSEYGLSDAAIRTREDDDAPNDLPLPSDDGFSGHSEHNATDCEHFNNQADEA